MFSTSSESGTLLVLLELFCITILPIKQFVSFTSLKPSHRLTFLRPPVVHTSKMSSCQSYFAHGFPFPKTADAPSFAGYTSTRIPAHFQGNAMPPQFQTAEMRFPSLQAQHGTAPLKSLPLDIMAQRARTPCKHFEHHLGWCPYGIRCHLYVVVHISRGKQH